MIKRDLFLSVFCLLLITVSHLAAQPGDERADNHVQFTIKMENGKNFVIDTASNIHDYSCSTGGSGWREIISFQSGDTKVLIGPYEDLDTACRTVPFREPHSYGGGVEWGGELFTLGGYCCNVSAYSLKMAIISGNDTMHISFVNVGIAHHCCRTYDIGEIPFKKGTYIVDVLPLLIENYGGGLDEQGYYVPGNPTQDSKYIVHPPDWNKLKK